VQRDPMPGPEKGVRDSGTDIRRAENEDDRHAHTVPPSGEAQLMAIMFASGYRRVTYIVRTPSQGPSDSGSEGKGDLNTR